MSGDIDHLPIMRWVNDRVQYSTVALGIQHGLSSEAYHHGPGLSHSELKRLRRTPFHYHALLDPSAPAKEPTPAMFNGTLVHCALLEPEHFELRYVIAPDVHKSSNVYKEFAQRCISGGLAPITQQQRDAAFAQAKALRTLPDVAALLANGFPEVSAYWRDPSTNVLCKCRPDWVGPVGYGKGAVLLDVKTASDASPEGFAKSVANFGYHTQADWYCTGYELATGVSVHGMVFAVVESEFPHACAAYMLDDEALRRAREDNRAALNKYAQCSEADHWPGYPREIQVITLPRWA
jgi:hypothetical protein